MRVLLLICLLVACTPTDNQIRVFGDSISGAVIPVNGEPVQPWPNVMQERRWATTYNSAQSGLTWKRFTVPDWLNCSPTRTVVVLWFGFNDVFQHSEDVSPHVARSLEILTDLGCETHVILPPEGWQGNRQERYNEIRTQISDTALAYGVPAHDIQYEWDMTLDRIHPNAELQLRLAIRMTGILGLD